MVERSKCRIKSNMTHKFYVLFGWIIRGTLFIFVDVIYVLPTEGYYLFPFYFIFLSILNDTYPIFKHWYLVTPFLEGKKKK